jgi:hypothetical protein
MVHGSKPRMDGIDHDERRQCFVLATGAIFSVDMLAESWANGFSNNCDENGKISRKMKVTC